MSKRGCLQENINHIYNRIEKACEKVSKSPDDITLLGVTKTIDEETINTSIELGITDIGENKPQEIQRKFSLIKSGVKWHMIGHLQSNKVKMIIDKVDLIHSLDRKSVCDEIEKRAMHLERNVDALIQVNIGEEAQKSGVDLDGLKDFIQYVSKCKHIHIKGLMCIAPYFEDPERVRPYFKEMKKLFDNISQQAYQNVEMTILSMGMTHDFDIAIEEGATMIRVGTGLYGSRDYQGG